MSRPLSTSTYQPRYGSSSSSYRSGSPSRSRSPSRSQTYQPATSQSYRSNSPSRSGSPSYRSGSPSRSQTYQSATSQSYRSGSPSRSSSPSRSQTYRSNSPSRSGNVLPAVINVVVGNRVYENLDSNLAIQQIADDIAARIRAGRLTYEYNNTYRLENAPTGTLVRRGDVAGSRGRSQ